MSKLNYDQSTIKFYIYYTRILKTMLSTNTLYVLLLTSFFRCQRIIRFNKFVLFFTPIDYYFLNFNNWFFRFSGTRCFQLRTGNSNLRILLCGSYEQNVDLWLKMEPPQRPIRSSINYNRQWNLHDWRQPKPKKLILKF